MLEFRFELLNNKAKEARIIKIIKNENDEVKAGDVLFEIEVAKATQKIISNFNGIIKSIEAEAGQMIKIGDVLVKFEGEVAELKEQNKAEKESKSPASNGFDFLGLNKKTIKRELESDITVIGGGPGGYVSAIKAAQLGAKVVLVERNKLGGTCLNVGCIPTKALVRSAEVYKNLIHAPKFGCQADNIVLKMNDIIERKNNVVSRLVQGIEYLMEKNNIEVIYGTGTLQDHNTVKVSNDQQESIIISKNIIIATGSKIANLPIKGADLPAVINSTQALDLRELPDSMVIVGGGVIGLEFAFIFNSFGVKVTVIEYLDKLLANVDSDISQEIEQIASARGIKVYTGARLERIEMSEDDKCIAVFVQDDREKYAVGEKVLMAVGRKPDFGNIDLEKIGIELDSKKRKIEINEKMQTSIPNIYAIGDVTDKIQLAHVASHQGIIAVKNIMGESCDMDYSAVPSAIFTDPEIAAVGINEETARSHGIDVEVGKFPVSANGKALTMGEEEGFIKVVKEKSTGKLIGAFMIGPHATDLIAELTLAIKNGIPAADIVETIHAHPTTAEVIHEAVSMVEGGALHYHE